MSRFTPKANWLVGGFAALTISACILRKLISALVTARFDAPIIEYVAAHRVAGLTNVMKTVTTAGNDLYLWIAVLIGGTILARLTRRWRPLIVIALAMLGAVSLNYVVKLAVARSRPPSLFWAIQAMVGPSPPVTPLSPQPFTRLSQICTRAPGAD